MTIEFSLSTRQRELQAMIHQFAATIIRPEAMKWDRAHEVPHAFLRQIVNMSQTLGTSVAMGPGAGDPKVTEMDAVTRALGKKHSGDTLNLTVYRGGRSVEVNVKLGEASDDVL